MRRPGAARHGQAGISLVEVMVAMVIMTVVIGTIATLVGASVRSKMIVASRSSDTETARQTLEMMSERLRNAGLNIDPAAQPDRCDDMVVAKDPALRPTATQLYVAGEIFNSNTTAGDQVIVLGYRLTGGRIVEDRSACGVWAPTTSDVSNPGITVTSLLFRYFGSSGGEITVPTTDEEAIRSIRVVQISLTVRAEEGRSGAQIQRFSRQVMLRNPRPDRSGWLPPAGWETNP
ncbi:MAG: prepilin-type N-terminal cleavage/methylation domain-containing protein [Armatimonadota bacterium]|nr:prepilin-type N-terminal cleavage/methylation domain-containing protein [Armatimonadota bacterium]MDR7484994.1 prepilin-type N-terminal cleavage/methylation domain-containing protein [Armatimonadota bacterium]MDR7533705.1 prepilin-type N-terminal cleavage/methylation domain-containing protein [Armatimonadota bacterium]MDR7535508.1 prepilin-type N-terminal cleavage/methylation domain-containing protein [Armatimonadota bacterium]